MNERLIPRSSRFLGSVLVLSALAVGCAPAMPPKDLVAARSSYDRVSRGPAAQLAPAELDTAKQALMRAELTFNEEGDAPVTRDLAYIAERKALAAEAQAGILQAQQEQQALDKDFKKSQIATIDKTQAELEAERRAREATSQEVAKTKEQLEAEKAARAEAEKRAAAAMASLAEIAKVKEESRGVVITLSGSVLFATGKHELLPIAQGKITEVAKALKDQGYKSILVEGHTDSRGNAAQNEQLSLLRAESVRATLVREGIPSDKIRAVGVGSSRPVADNATAEGRANNRRVEIVVEPDR